MHTSPNIQAVRQYQLHAKPRGGDITCKHDGTLETDGKKKPPATAAQAKVELYVWDKAVLLLNVTLEHKADRTQCSGKIDVHFLFIVMYIYLKRALFWLCLPFIHYCFRTQGYTTKCLVKMMTSNKVKSIFCSLKICLRVDEMPCRMENARFKKKEVWRRPQSLQSLDHRLQRAMVWTILVP